MALLCSRLVSRALIGQRAVPSRFYAGAENLPEPMELATGPAKFEKQQIMAGNLDSPLWLTDHHFKVKVTFADDPASKDAVKIADPFKELPVERIDNSTRENPNLVPSYFDCRMVACSCNPDNNSLMWMWVFKGEPRRCRCGHWFKLVEYKV